ncbi:MAG: glycoside hydrolase family 28 protein [Acidobacteriota bacterium]
MADNTARREFLRLAGKGAATGMLLPGLAAAQSGPAQATAAQSASRDGKPLRIPPAVWNVRASDAAGDGKTIDTPAINSLIERAAHGGGGLIWFPPGIYACYSIHLRSNVALYLDAGAVILAADAPPSGGYDHPESNQPWEAYQDFGHNHWHNSLIWGEDLQNISITGPGRIWGRGLSKGRGSGPDANTPGVANKAIALKNCRSVILRDFQILQGGHFGILATGVNNLTIDNLTIDTNRDGMDIDCCRNVRISNCTVNSPWDDGICLKSSYALGRAVLTEDVTVSNCFVTAGYELGSVLDGTFRRFPDGTPVARQGRIKLGTESAGGFRNIAISNCVLDGCKGLALETVDGGLLEEVAISNITLRSITDTPLFLRLGRRMRAPQGSSIGTLNRVLIDNIVSYDCASPLPVMIMGVPDHPVADIRINNLYLHHRPAAPASQASAAPPEQQTLYPEANRFGPMPSQGFFIRHARNITIANTEIACASADGRPFFALADVNDIDLFRVRMRAPEPAPRFLLQDVRELRISACRGMADQNISWVKNRVI